MSLRRTFILFIILVLIAGYVYFFEIQSGKKRITVENEESKLLVFDKDSVSQLTFLPSGIRIKRQNSAWVIVSPLQLTADQKVVADLINSLFLLKSERFVSGKREDFEKFGLDEKNQTSLILTYTNGKGDSLFLGEKNLDGTLVYFRLNNKSDVSLISSSYFYDLTQSLFYFRDKSVLKYEQENISQIKIQKKDQLIICLKHPTNEWYLEKPINERCDQEFIRTLFEKIAEKNFTEVVSEGNAGIKPFGLTQPWLKISFFDNTKNRFQMLSVGKMENAGYFANNNIGTEIFKIDSSFVAEINPTIFKLRDKSIVSFERDSLDEILVNYPNGGSFFKKNSSANWQMISPDSCKIKSWKINSMLYDINNLTVFEFVDTPYRADKFYGFDNPQIDLLVKKNNKKVVHLIFGKEVKNKLYLKNKLTEKIYQIESSLKNSFILDINDLKINDKLF